MAFVIHRNKDVCIMNSKGVHTVSFGAKSKKPYFKMAGITIGGAVDMDSKKLTTEDRMSHSLDSYQFLKLEP